MVQLFIVVLGALRVFFRSRSDMALEILALRQQLAVLKRQRSRPPLNSGDRFFWTTLRRLWPGWTDVLLIVQPETVVRWHRAGFRLYWRWRSRPRGGRPRIIQELRDLIGRLAQENPTGARPKFTRNCRSWALPWRNEPWPDICAVFFGGGTRSGSG